jgi:CcmD family protein
MTKKMLLTAALVGGLCLGVGSVVRAEASAAEDRSTSFQAVQGAVTEDVPGAPLLVTAYALIWAGVLGYVWRVARLQERGMAQVQELSRLIQAHGGDKKPGE